MNQQELLRNVARRTGETVSTIRHLGFNLENDPYDRGHKASCLDWDGMETSPVNAFCEPVFGEPVSGEPAIA